jgi:hypothetical protein
MRPTTDSQHEWKGDQDVRVTSSKARSKERRLRRELYPPIDFHKSGWLEVSELHSLYWEVSGNPGGQVRVSCGQERKRQGPKTKPLVRMEQ